MPTKKRTPRLGRGLSSLMAQPVAVTPAAPPSADSSKAVAATPAQLSAPAQETPSDNPVDSAPPAQEGGLAHLTVEAIHPNPHQPRQAFDPDALQRLANSITKDGLMQPILVRPTADDPTRYELIAGERRWRAAQLAGLTALPAVIRETDDAGSAELALIENLQREDLNPIEKAEAFERFGQQYDLNHDAIAKRVGLERSTVANLIRLLSLCPEVRALTAEGRLSMGQARAIAGLTDEDQQKSLAAEAIRAGLSVRAVEAKAKALRDGDPATPANTAGQQQGGADLIQDLSHQLSDQLQTKVHVKRGRKKHAGSVTIEFFSLDQFDALMERMGVEIR
ncbi:MAG: ParB/RepB/Spo0J family partition protein [Planctomycetota bacterium]